MPIQDTYPNLPGIVSQIQDNQLQLATPPQSLTQSVLLLGVATDGPVNTPIPISSLAMAEQLFGATTLPTSITGMGQFRKSLTRGAYEAFQAGCTDIRLVRVATGTSASVALTDSSSANKITLTANYPGTKYNGLTVSVTAPAGTASGTITITTLDNVAHNFSFTGTSLYGDIMNAINASPINVSATQAASGANALATATLTPMASTNFSGGLDGTSPTDAQYSDALVTAYKQLEQYGADVISPLGAYLQPQFPLNVDGTVSSVANTQNGDTVFFGQNLAQFVARISVRNHSAIGVISVPPLDVPTFTNVVQRANQLVATAAGAYTFHYAGDYSPSGGPRVADATGTDGKTVDIGYFLQILGGPDVVANTPALGNYVIDGAASYAGMITSLAPQSATTNKVVKNALGLAFSYGASVQDSLVANKFVVLKVANGSVRVVADQTYSAAGGDFTKLSTLRVTYASMEAVRQATSGFIGESANPAVLNAMGTAIDGALNTLKKAGALIDYEYHISATSQDQIDGNLRVTLGLVPALQIRKIYVTIALKAPAAIG